MASDVCFSGSSRRATRKIFAPSSAKRSAIERPSPVPPPVIKIFRPFNKSLLYIATSNAQLLFCRGGSSHGNCAEPVREPDPPAFRPRSNRRRKSRLAFLTQIFLRQRRLRSFLLPINSDNPPTLPI